MLHDTGLVIIDIQKEFCIQLGDQWYGGSEATENVAMLIAEKVDMFRPLMNVFAVYYGDEFDTTKPLDFHLYQPEKGDIIIDKYTDSAFHSGSLDPTLETMKIDKLVVCGVNTSACVLFTVMSALEIGMQVTVLKDLCANGASMGLVQDQYALDMMAAAGAMITTSEEYLMNIQLGKVEHDQDQQAVG